MSANSEQPCGPARTKADAGAQTKAITPRARPNMYQKRRKA